jgi:hypothetical protein
MEGHTSAIKTGRELRNSEGALTLRSATTAPRRSERCILLRHLRAALMDKHNVDVSAQTVPRDLEAIGTASSEA